MDTTGLRDAELTLFRLDDLLVHLIDAPTHRVLRGARHPQDALDETYKLILQRRGTTRIELGGRCVTMRPGDWSLYDPRAPYVVHNDTPTSLMAIQIPRERLRGVRVPELHTSDAPVCGGSGLSAVMGSFLSSLAEQLSIVPDEAAPSMGGSLVDLLISTLGTCSGRVVQPLPEVLKQRVQHYVRQNYSDPDLNLEGIAKAMRCSKRYLHRVFEQDDVTLDKFIWRVRLGQARALLQTDAAYRRTISEIASTCGFRSNAHFCRLFKSEFGQAPSAWRRPEA